MGNNLNLLISITLNTHALGTSSDEGELNVWLMKMKKLCQARINLNHEATSMALDTHTPWAQAVMRELNVMVFGETLS